MRKALALCLPLVALASVLAAQSKPPTMIRLEPKTMSGVAHGKAVVVKGKAGPQAHRFGLEKLSYMHPVAVAVRPVHPGDEVGLKISKYSWNRPLRQGQTKGEILRYAFRTEGEFQIAVDAKKPGTPYRLMVWVGDETRPQLTPVVLKASDYRSNHTRQDEGGRGGGNSLVLWVIAAALTAIVLLLAALILRRRPS